MKVGVLGLQGDVREHLHALEVAGATPVAVKTHTDLHEVAGLIVPGGESTTIGKLLDRFELLDPLRARIRSGLPLYGTCAGAILMAREVVGDQQVPFGLDALDIVVRRNAYGRQIDSFESDISIEGLDPAFRAVFIRAPVIEGVADDVEVLAVYDGKPVLVRRGPMMASTFHPEMTPDARVHEMFVDSIKAVG